ncbi:MAG: hypothetical protein ACRDWA_12630 [Acidimicrobiia bacterium]
MVFVAGFLLFRPDKLFAEDPVDESLPEAFATTSAPSSSPTSMDPSSTALETTRSPATSASPTTLAAGQFTGIDHRAAGTATTYEENGRFVLRFVDDTDIQNGPDLYVWVIEGSTYKADHRLATSISAS